MNPGAQKIGLRNPPRSTRNKNLLFAKTALEIARAKNTITEPTIRAKVACKTNHPTDSKWVESSRLSVEKGLTVLSNENASGSNSSTLGRE